MKVALWERHTKLEFVLLARDYSVSVSAQCDHSSARAHACESSRPPSRSSVRIRVPTQTPKRTIGIQEAMLMHTSTCIRSLPVNNGGSATRVLPGFSSSASIPLPQMSLLIETTLSSSMVGACSPSLREWMMSSVSSVIFAAKPLMR